MRVALDGRGIGPSETGVGRATRLLAEALARAAPAGSGLELLTLGSVPGLASAGALRLHPCRMPPTAHPFTELWEATLLLRRLRGLGVELLHAAAFRAPWLGSMPSVTTVHDAAAFVVPETLPLKFRVYVRASVRAAMRRSRIVLCPSEAVRSELERLFPSRRARIEVVPWGTPPLPQLGEIEAERRRARLRLPERYVLAVGAQEPRKNLRTLLEGLALLGKGSPDPPSLVLLGAGVGQADGRPPNIDRPPPAPYIKRIGYLDLRDLASVYRGADALAYPSLYEGFGLPILEAMSLAVPVLTSNCGAMLEVAGDAAMLVDPRSKEQIAAGLARLLTDRPLRRELIDRGRSRAEQFRWDWTAERTWTLYEAAVGPASPTESPR